MLMIFGYTEEPRSDECLMPFRYRSSCT